VLIFLGVVIVFTTSSLEFQQVTGLDWSVTPIHPTPIHWIIRFGGNAEVLSQTATETAPEFKNAF